MKIRPSLFAFLLLASPALADECTKWTAGLEEDEGGKVMIARTCQPAGGAAHELSLQCGKAGYFWLHFLPVAPTDYPPGENENFHSRFKFAFDEIVVEKDMIFQGMDGAMAAEVSHSEPLGELLKTSNSVTITEMSGKVPSATFTLKGSKGAIGKVEASCGN